MSKKVKLALIYFCGFLFLFFLASISKATAGITVNDLSPGFNSVVGVGTPVILNANTNEMLVSDNTIITTQPGGAVIEQNVEVVELSTQIADRQNISNNQGLLPNDAQINNDEVAMVIVIKENGLVYLMKILPKYQFT